MQMQNAIRQRLEQQIAPQHLEIINESHRHSVPPNSETHFKVLIVSDAFEGERAVQRHRRVYTALAAELAGGVHALSVHAYTPGEWAAEGAAPESPPCMGGGKRRD